MQHLSAEVLEDAIDDALGRLRSGHSPTTDLFAEVAAEHGINPVALKRHFDQRYPDGTVGAALPSLAEYKAAAHNAEIRTILAAFEEWGPIDGRELRLDGAVHTLIKDLPSRKSVLAVSHADMKTVRIPIDEFLAMKKTPV